MDGFLDRLGISSEILAFFQSPDLSFHYGEDEEIFRPGFHYVPTTRNLWVSGNPYAPEVVITNSAMEAVSWLVCNRTRFKNPFAFTFVSVGNLPCDLQMKCLVRDFRGRKFSLVFGNCLLGRITDISVALQLRGTNVELRRRNKITAVSAKGSTWFLHDYDCSLNHLEKISGIRTGVRTRKPNNDVTFFDKLKYNGCSFNYFETDG
ncbi:hypothetical protein IM792_02905 [Mucilaginibacter sp. JRF]|uniref:hypothetical protein n=1 Tax=Mucilaginibacter sp. JRF TaxID=2780088 RepID=UPI001882D088|nr:hypothetical protein [Mucilaginibacter sp. JRF]MBE9583385.1 hypothetical protein [Mucilaginibacter sp. JRF]